MTPSESRIVRCAIALGYKQATHPSLVGIWWWEPGDVEHDAPTCDLPTFGEDTPEGWACTGPLLVRFGLCLTSPGRDGIPWGCLLLDTESISTGDGPCAAIAEWVSAHVEGGKVKA